MTDLDRIGIDVSEKLPLGDAVVWASQNGVRIIDVQLDGGGEWKPSYAKGLEMQASLATVSDLLGLYAFYFEHRL